MNSSKVRDREQELRELAAKMRKALATPMNSWSTGDVIADSTVEGWAEEIEASLCNLCAEGMPLKKYLDGTLRHFDGLMAWHPCAAQSLATLEPSVQYSCGCTASPGSPIYCPVHGQVQSLTELSRIEDEKLKASEIPLAKPTEPRTCWYGNNQHCPYNEGAASGAQPWANKLANLSTMDVADHNGHMVQWVRKRDVFNVMLAAPAGPAKGLSEEQVRQLVESWGPEGKWTQNGISCLTSELNELLAR